MGRESLSNEDKEAWVEDHEQLRQFMSSVDTGEEGGEGGSFRWLVSLPEPDIEAVILNYCRRGDTSPSHLDELEQDLDRTLAEINQIEEESLLAHPTATPLMRNEHGTPVLFFHPKTPTRSILRLLAEIRGLIDDDCDYMFPPAPGNCEMSILLDLVRVALRQGYRRSPDVVGFVDLATGLPGCFSGDGRHPLQVSLLMPATVSSCA